MEFGVRSLEFYKNRDVGKMPERFLPERREEHQEERKREKLVLPFVYLEPSW